MHPVRNRRSVREPGKIRSPDNPIARANACDFRFIAIRKPTL
jgi:hypothetical protein